MTKCPRCQEENATGGRFCAHCGNIIDPSFHALQEHLDRTIKDRVGQVISAEYKDQKLLELETSQAVADRLTGWAKTFGFLVGIPIAILLVILAVLGIRSYEDLKRKVDTAQTELSTSLGEAKKTAEKLRDDSVKLATEYQRLDSGLESSKAVMKRVEALTEEYSKLAPELEKTKQLAQQVANLDAKVTSIGDAVASALILGNGHYSPPYGLESPLNDANSIAEIMRGLGFRTETYLNVSRAEMQEALGDFIGRLSPGDTAFVYYTGHGGTLKGVNYLIPVDFSPDLLGKGEIPKDTAVPVSDLIEDLRKSNARVILILDASRNVFEFPQPRAIPPKLDEPPEGSGIFILYSASPGEETFESTTSSRKHSLFAQVLMEEIRKPDRDLAELSRTVSAKVVQFSKAMGKIQTPVSITEISGKVFLAGRTKPGNSRVNGNAP